MAEHRVPMLGSSWRRNEDPAVSRDPRVRAVVGALAALPAPELRADFRAELRAQLVAITPRIVRESADATSAALDAPGRPAPHPRPMPHGSRAPQAVAPAHHDKTFLDRLRGIHLGRPLGVAASVIVVFALLLGGAVVMSKKSLPGDTLYGLKRASERFQLATADGPVEKARDYLNFATTRAQEVKDLLGHTSALAGGSGVHAGGGVNGSTAKLIASTLGSADSDVKSAAELVGSQAVRQKSPSALALMTTWVPGQLQRLADIAAATSDPQVRSEVRSSAALVRAADSRAAALRSQLGCGCLGSSGTDQLGPKPCSTCTAAPGVPTSPRGTHPGATHTPALPRPGSGTSSRQPNGATSSGGAASTTGPKPSSGGSSPGLPLPSLPIPPLTSSLPVGVSSCSATVSLPILGGLGVGLCDGVHVSAGP